MSSLTAAQNGFKLHSLQHEQARWWLPAVSRCCSNGNFLLRLLTLSREGARADVDSEMAPPIADNDRRGRLNCLACNVQCQESTERGEAKETRWGAAAVQGIQERQGQGAAATGDHKRDEAALQR